MSKDSSIAKNMAQLEEIVEWFEGQEVDLDQAVDKYEEGIKLARQLKTQITDIENKIKKINK